MTFPPAPMKGWHEKEAKSQNMGMLGGTSGVEKDYSAPGTNNRRKRITLMIMGESTHAAWDDGNGFISWRLIISCL